ncbi:maltose ABC transporter substrate-binding protein MalE [Marinobacterium nitratireducens]|uniref:Maltodextrin-binding protein n=1 Tax=Marinobacterium nitratireducens TaxID=518897 RepID=A0A917ZQ18_9GAMM|nr:maltose/maltodextrin ABC transporter substrate-binding protein MalE [Marinobacterium nitratireducens]GGO87385.1 maltose ABC transporter substrate-binding protein MalE [Marinobacterium nitratireducens]
MNKNKLIATLALSFAASGFGAAAQAAIEEGKLVVWINGDKGYKGLAEVGKRFTDETGIAVEVSHPDNVTDKFQQAAATGNGPDIFIWPHDRFGEWAASGLIVPVEPSDEVKNGIVDFAWDAVTVNGRHYGYPMAVEAIGLIYNKALIDTPPATFADVVALDRSLAAEGKKAILWDYNNTYFSWPLFAAEGGYPFRKTADGYDVSDTGVNNPGSLRAAGLLQDLIDTGVMPRGADYGAMESAFNKGEVAMMLNGPWSWANLKKSGIDFGVAAIPAVGEQPGKPLTGVLAATLNAASPNRDLAVEFLENYLLRVEGLKTVNEDVPLGAVANRELMEELSQDPNIYATFKNAEMGEPMPNVPEMGAFWSSMEPALKNITSGRQSVKDALDDAAKRILN